MTRMVPKPKTPKPNWAGKSRFDGAMETVHGAGATVMLQVGDVAVAPELSVTLPVKEYGPAVVGMPDTPPNEFNVRTGGRVPVAMAYEVNAPVPPDAANAEAYGAFTVPALAGQFNERGGC